MTPEERLRALRDAERWSGDAAQPPQDRPRPDRLRAGVVTAVVLAAIVAVVGGLSLLPHAPAPASPTRSPSPTTTTDADAAAPWDASLVRSYHRYSTAEAAAVPGCTSSHLRLWAQPEGGSALGTYYQGVFIRNAGPLCSVRNAGVRLLVGRAASVPLAIRSNGSELLPTGASELLQAMHVNGCITSDQQFRDLPSEPLSLRIGHVVTHLDAHMPFAPPCDLGFSTWELTTPRSLQQREPGFSTGLSVSVPSIPDAYRGGAFDYTVALRNTGARAVTIRPGEVFRQIVFDQRVASVTTATMHVGSGRTLAPGAVLRLRMHVPRLGDPAAAYWIGWYLPDGTGAVAAQE
jgi:hypothetical protein